jgi:Zn-dependent protease
MGGIRLGRLFGIPIHLNYSFLVLLALLLIWQGVSGVALLVVTFASVLVHEIGHALVARQLHVPIVGIDLHFFGGAAKMARMPATAGHEILIAVVGPVVSFVVAALGFALFIATGLQGFLYLTVINALLGGFNLLPALPMDGGRVLRAALSRRMGRLRATRISVHVARVVAVGIGVFGLLRGNLFLPALAVMLWMMAGAELRAARYWRYDNEQGVASWLDARGDRGQAEILDRDGKPVESPARFTVEEQRSAEGVRRWVIRGPDGQVIMMSEQPLRW